MIDMQIIKNECKKHYRCSNECPFYDDEVNVGNCLIDNYPPCDWDMNRITTAFENMSAETFNLMHDALMKKILDVMSPDRKEV